MWVTFNLWKGECGLKEIGWSSVLFSLKNKHVVVYILLNVLHKLEMFLLIIS